MARVILVSNRIAIPRDGAQRAGGLEVALKPILKETSGVWFGWSGKVVETGAVNTETDRSAPMLTNVLDLTLLVSRYSATLPPLSARAST